jgi:hypothetical protein
MNRETGLRQEARFSCAYHFEEEDGALLVTMGLRYWVQHASIRPRQFHHNTVFPKSNVSIIKKRTFY